MGNSLIPLPPAYFRVNLKKFLEFGKHFILTKLSQMAMKNTVEPENVTHNTMAA